MHRNFLKSGSNYEVGLNETSIQHNESNLGRHPFRIQQNIDLSRIFLDRGGQVNETVK